MTRRLILATGNPHKVEELRGLLAETDFEVLPASVCGGMPDVEESGDTFAANAALKARALRRAAPGDAWVMADDSGLEVDALGGAPGVYSARYAGAGADDAANVAKLLRALAEVPEGRRKARFRCVLCVIPPGGAPRYYDGTVDGVIAPAAAGADGFGYDPVFVPEGHAATFAELGERVKAELSHRARAVRAFREAE